MVATGAKAGRQVPKTHTTDRGDEVSCPGPHMSVEAYIHRRGYQKPGAGETLFLPVHSG